MSDEKSTPAAEPKTVPAKAAPAKAAPKAEPKSDDRRDKSRPEATFEVDEEAGTVTTKVGSLGNPGSVKADEDDEDTSVATEVGSLGWPEGAENEPGTGPDGKQVTIDDEPSWKVEKRER